MPRITLDWYVKETFTPSKKMNVPQNLKDSRADSVVTVALSKINNIDPIPLW